MSDAEVEPIAYIDRMKEFHSEHDAYRWAQALDSVPLYPVAVPLAQAHIALVGLGGARLDASPVFDLTGDATLRPIPIGTPRDDVAYSHFGFKLDRVSADPATSLPLWALEQLAREGRIGGVAGPAVSCMGAMYSQRRVRTELIPAVLQALEPLGADIVLVVPACPLDHQTAALVARAVESNGTPTIVLAGAKDIVAAAGAPRAVYVHSPLGWLVGMPEDEEGQRDRVLAVLEAGVAVKRSGQVVELPPHYPLGAVGVPDQYAHPDLELWESREYMPGYVTNPVASDRE